MRNPINAKVREIKPSGIRRFFDIANEIPGVISLGVGEPDFDTPWIVRDEGVNDFGIVNINSGSFTEIFAKLFLSTITIFTLRSSSVMT